MTQKDLSELIDYIRTNANAELFATNFQESLDGRQAVVKRDEIIVSRNRMNKYIRLIRDINIIAFPLDSRDINSCRIIQRYEINDRDIFDYSSKTIFE